MIRGSILSLLGLGSFVAVYIMMDPDKPEEVTAPAYTTAINDSSGQAPVAFELRPGTSQTEPPRGTPIASTVRDVTPPTMTAAPRVSGPLVRIEREPPVEPEPQARMERLFNPVVVSAGTIAVGGRDIHLAGVAAPDSAQSCGEGSTAWPCGIMARAALRRFVRARAIECEVPAGAGEVPDRATCHVGGQDIAAWLIAQGWAKRTGDRYEDQEMAARDAELGLWSKTRPDAQAELASSG